MNKTQEALKLALEALKELRMLGMNMQWHDSWLAKSETAITAIREALAEQEQRWTEFNETTKKNIEHAEWYLSTHPAQQQEPVAWANPNDLQNFDMKVRTNGGPLHTVPLYTRPQAREPLTQYMVESCPYYGETMRGAYFDGWLKAEAAHGIGEKK